MVLCMNYFAISRDEGSRSRGGDGDGGRAWNEPGPLLKERIAVGWDSLNSFRGFLSEGIFQKELVGFQNAKRTDAKVDSDNRVATSAVGPEWQDFEPHHLVSLGT